LIRTLLPAKGGVKRNPLDLSSHYHPAFRGKTVYDEECTARTGDLKEVAIMRNAVITGIFLASCLLFLLLLRSLFIPALILSSAALGYVIWRGIQLMRQKDIQRVFKVRRLAPHPLCIENRPAISGKEADLLRR
jgi:hypothetical protein